MGCLSKMPSSKKPRKAYKPRMVNAPVTEGLVQMFTECLDLAETGLHLRVPTTDHFDAVAAVLNVVGPCTMRKFGERHEWTIAMSSAALAFNAAADRAEARRKAGKEEALEKIYDSELLAISRGIDAARAAIPHLDIRSMAEQRYRNLARKSQ